MERTEQQWKKRFEEAPPPDYLSPDRKEALWADINRKKRGKRIPLWASHLAAGITGILLSWIGFQYFTGSQPKTNIMTTDPAQAEKVVIRDTIRLMVPAPKEVHDITDDIQQRVTEGYVNRQPITPVLPKKKTTTGGLYTEAEKDLPKEQDIALQPAEIKQENVALAAKPKVVHISDIAPHREKPSIASQLMKMGNRGDNQYTSVSPFKAYQKN